MASFFDLPKAVQATVCRLHLVQEEPININTLEKLCEDGDDRQIRPEHTMPCLMRVSPKIENMAAVIFYSENTFELKDIREILYLEANMWPRHRKWVRKISFSWNPRRASNLDGPFRTLANYKKLDQLTIKLDEAAMTTNQIGLHGPNKWHRSLELGPQLRLRLLYQPGMNSFRELRGFKNVDFLPLTPQDQDGSGKGGLIPGGLFETLIKREIAQPANMDPYERKGIFRIFDLPPELRTRIYAILLVFQGVTYPSANVPTSTACHYWHIHEAKRDSLPRANSALDILLVNRQIHDEAAGLFYHHNDLVFCYPSHFQAFTLNLSLIRLRSVRNVTLFHRDHNEGGIHTLDVTLSMLRLLPALKKFHLLVAANLVRKRYGRQAPHIGYVPGQITGVKTMFTLRGVEDIKLRDLALEDRLESRRLYVGATDTTVGQAVCEQELSILKHLNQGIAMAQQGVVVSELYTSPYWHESDPYPVLDGSTCSAKIGCLCGTEPKSSGKEEHSNERG